MKLTHSLLIFHVLHPPVPPPSFTCSMEKLFDLMLMGFKYQVQCSSQLGQLIEV